jgi:hypothetical protein
MQVAVIHGAFEDSPRTVALVEVGDRPVMEALEYAYHRTQNLGGSWSRGSKIQFQGKTHENPDFSPDVTVMAALPVHEGVTYGLRSTSMGDHMLYGNTKYEVAMMGFEEVA